MATNIESKINTKLVDAHFSAFTELIGIRKVLKKEQLIREGQFCKHIFYVKKGLLYSAFNSDDGERHVIQIAYEDYWISDLYSFFSGKPDSEVITIEKEKFEQACREIPSFEHFFRVLIQNAYVSNQRRLTQNKTADAEFRYLTLLDKHPQILQRVPQYIVASYLGIKPQSLSRIRKKLT